MKDKKLKEAFMSLVENNPSKFNKSVTSLLKVKLSEKFRYLEQDVVSKRFDYLSERSEGEKRFRDMHVVQKHDYPNGTENTFTSNKERAGTPADSPVVDTEEPDPLSTNELMKKTRIWGRADSFVTGGQDDDGA